MPRGSARGAALDVHSRERAGRDPSAAARSAVRLRQDRLQAAEQTASLALDGALMVSAPELHHVPERYQRADGSSRLRPVDQLLYTTEALLDAEQRLLDAGRRTDGADRPGRHGRGVCGENLPGREHGLTVDQALAVQKIATSGRALDVLVGPAGTGKSTAMAGLKAVWESAHGAGSLLGLAPSAAAAEVLATELPAPVRRTPRSGFTNTASTHTAPPNSSNSSGRSGTRRTPAPAIPRHGRGRWVRRKG